MSMYHTLAAWALADRAKDNFDVVQKFLLPMQFADIRTTKGLTKQVSIVIVATAALRFSVQIDCIQPPQLAGLRMPAKVQHVFGDLKKGIDAELEKLLG